MNQNEMIAYCIFNHRSCCDLYYYICCNENE